MTNEELFNKWNKKQQQADAKWRDCHMQQKLSIDSGAKAFFRREVLKWQRESQLIGQFMQDAGLIQADD